MSTHYEGVGAKDAAVSLALPLGEVGQDVLSSGQYAICISADDVMYIAGTPEELKDFAMKLMRKADDAVAHSQLPLQAEDFEWDGDDNAYVCPRCETIFEPGEFENYDRLMKAISVHVGEHEKQAGRG